MLDSTHHDDDQHQGVRFNSVTEEISPTTHADGDSMDLHKTTTAVDNTDRMTEDQRKEIRDLSVSLQQSRLQTNRMNQFVFEPVSLPPSRVPSGASSTQAYNGSGQTDTPLSVTHSPLTPAHSGSKDDQQSSTSKGAAGVMPVTPQVSPPVITSQHIKETKPSAAAEAREAARPKTPSELHGAVPVHPKQPSVHINVPKGDSLPSSRDDSPANTPLPSGAQSPFARPMTPQGDPNNPYAKDKRAPHVRGSVDQRFIFSDRPRSIFSSGPSSPRTSMDTSRPEEKRSSIFASSRKNSSDSIPKKDKEKDKDHHHALSDLKRFLKFGGSKKDKTEKSTKESKEAKSKVCSRKGTVTPPSGTSSVAAMPFADDHGLEAKYGKFERILGAGAGGSVRLMKRQDGVTFAVKQFREKHSWETEKGYNKKITAEFCIGSTLHNGNIIEALDIVSEKGRWYEVMEYAPYDLFNIVMTGKMSREEVACSTMQILSGVAYIHSMGLAHRDLKLDNVVVNEYGIMKIIDFGSAHVFQYPFEKTPVLAEGVVGSDPYLAPEVFNQKQYDAQKVDVWSLAIIFCCMSLRRFPWKCPKSTDNSFKLFITQPTEEELQSSLYPNRPHPKSEPVSQAQSDAENKSRSGQSSQANNETQSTNETTQTSASSQTTSTTQTAPQPTIIKGPWRLLRLLPRETRHIVGRMLELDPKERADLDEVIRDSWVTKTDFCTQEVAGKVIPAPGHEHVLSAGDDGEVKVAKEPPQIDNA